jgi:programmed cell death protein 5
MRMTNDEEIKKRLLQQRMQEQFYMQQQVASQRKQAEAMLNDIMARVLDKKARERMANMRLVRPELAMQLEMYLAQLHEAGHLKSVITEEQLIQMLKKISEKKETRIIRK